MLPFISNRVFFSLVSYLNILLCKLQDSSSVMGPLLSSSFFEPYLTSLVQELFLVAQSSDNHQLQQFASWVLAFLRHHLWSKELLGVDGDSNVSETNSKPVSQNFPEDSVVLKLSLWLMEFKYTEVDFLAIFCVQIFGALILIELDMFIRHSPYTSHA